MSNLQWTAQGRQDVDDIYDYIARQDHRPATADKFVRELRDKCQFLADTFAAGSTIGTQRDDLVTLARLFTLQALGDRLSTDFKRHRSHARA
jgi:plasmid stabilization system protein ParE